MLARWMTPFIRGAASRRTYRSRCTENKRLTFPQKSLGCAYEFLTVTNVKVLTMPALTNDTEASAIELRRKRQILRVVAAVVAEAGFDGATMRKIADRAGVSTGMLTYYYKNKRDLIMDMLRDAYERSVHNIDSSIGEQVGPERVEAVFSQMLEGNRSHVFPLSFWIAYWAEAARDEELRRFSLKAPTRDVFYRSIEAGISLGHLRQDLDLDLAADLLMTVWQGARAEVGLGSLQEDRVTQVVGFLMHLMAKQTSQCK